MRVENLPFHIGTTEFPNNPPGIPDTFPFELYFNESFGTLFQKRHDDLMVILEKAYRVGNAIGTPLNTKGHGKPYLDDFVGFIKRIGLPRGALGLEIGAGYGFLTQRLKHAGYSIVGVEPGVGYGDSWTANDIEVVRDFFPTPKLPGQFDFICSYCVLEHISEPVQFANAIRRQLTPTGVAVFAVPDCTAEIKAGDPTILFHEHLNFFDSGSLRRILERADLHAHIMQSKYGRCLYAIATPGKARSSIDSGRDLDLDLGTVATYPQRSTDYLKDARARLMEFAALGTVGIYGAARALPLLDSTAGEARFFDDDPLHQGRFLPPFRNPIEGRESLLATPVDTLIVMSRTFGNRIRDSLRQDGYSGSILTLEQL